MISKIGLGGGCHWCTEAVFQFLKGVIKVEQGYIASSDEQNSFSEAVLVHFEENEISLQTLIEVHLHTHSATSKHSMREKYRSAIYTFNQDQTHQSNLIIKHLQKDFKEMIVAEVYPFKAFKHSDSKFQNYYIKDPAKPFCKTFINPKLEMI